MSGLLGIDLGTTGVKAVVWSADGAQLGQGYREYPTLFPRPGWLELDAQAVWDATVTAVRQAVKRAGVPVQALSFSLLGEATLAVDARGVPLTNLVIGFDQRGTRELEELRGRMADRDLMAPSGQPLQQNYSLLKWLWWQRHLPDVWARTARLLCAGEYLMLRMGVPPATDPSMAARTLAYDRRAGDWRRDLLASLGIPPEWMSPVVPAGTAVGEVSSQAAEELGLAPGTKVVVGGHDQLVAALGSGVVAPGVAVNSTGTVDCLTLVHDLADDWDLVAAGFPSYDHVVAGRLVTMGYTFTGGSLLRWFRDTFARDLVAEAASRGVSVYDLLVGGPFEEPTGLLVIPYFEGTGAPWLDPSARGTVLGLRLRTDRLTLSRAVAEGVAMEIATIARRVRELSVPLAQVRAVGGGARSAAWLQLKADLLQVPVQRVQGEEAGAAGAAALAGIGAGVFSSFEEAAAALVRLGEVFEPRPEVGARYRPWLELYGRAAEQVRALYRAWPEAEGGGQ